MTEYFEALADDASLDIEGFDVEYSVSNMKASRGSGKSIAHRNPGLFLSEPSKGC